MTFNQILLIYRTLVYHFLPLCSTLLKNRAHSSVGILANRSKDISSLYLYIMHTRLFGNHTIYSYSKGDEYTFYEYRVKLLNKKHSIINIRNIQDALKSDGFSCIGGNVVKDFLKLKAHYFDYTKIETLENNRIYGFKTT